MKRAAHWGILLLLSGVSTLVAAAAQVPTVSPTAHRGWTNAWILSNGLVEAVVVPEVGRVMQFRFAGETNGPFWENPELAGKPMPAQPWTASHGSFGGDKTWPAPQAAWDWPPPDVFDASALSARVDGSTLVLTSPVSHRFGIRTERRISLVPDQPGLRIVTRYEKVSGDPVDAGVWVITQTSDPVAVFVPVPDGSRFPLGTSTNWGVPTQALTRHQDLIRLTRDPKSSHKIGNDGTTMVWVGTRDVLVIDVARVPGGRYADDGCSVEVYTNPDPVPYVELETLGPLHRMAVGDSIAATNAYTLFRRKGGTDEAEARRILKERRKPFE